jgi:cAMP and cAMP-inhibited cGMP 3',5'-cyclic phosphodiesterase 10
MESEVAVQEYLDTNRGFLEEYVLENIEAETIERWFIRKGRMRVATLPPSFDSPVMRKRSKKGVCAVSGESEKRKILAQVTKEVQEHTSSTEVLLHLSQAVSAAIGAHGYTVYVMDSEQKNLYCVHKDGEQYQGKPLSFEVDETIPSYVARTGTIVRLGSLEQLPPEFKGGLGLKRDNATCVLCVPVLQAEGGLDSVIELIKTDNKIPFTPQEEEVASSYFVWGGIAIQYSQLYKSLEQHKVLNDTILKFMKVVIEDVTRIDFVLEDIINAACQLVDADRGSLFLVDHEREELYARVFDQENRSPSVELTHDWVIARSRSVRVEDADVDALTMLRIPMSSGIAGHVARTGEVLNIRDCYNDPRFNSAIDEKTGYRTRTILCMPIKKGSEVIGVMQMVNKKNNGPFSTQDEVAFQALAAYCGVAIQSSMLYIQLKRSQQHQKVATEVFVYHRHIDDTEVESYLERPMDLTAGYDIDSHGLDTVSIPEDVKPLLAVKMLDKLVDLSSYSRESLMRFLLTVRKCYRPVAYHNWNHAFSVAHASYVIMSQSLGVFRENEKIGLFVSCLCHDLDHRGYNNDFMKKHSTPLAALYSTSILENHHFNMAYSILQDQDCNIFAGLARKEYKAMMELMRKCILATDLARFFKNRKELENMMESGDLDIVYNSIHRDIVFGVVMTGCDVGSAAKPWDVHRQATDVIFKEFYAQGDQEKADGLTPIPMMDRDRHHELPKHQVGFINHIVAACYETLLPVLPCVKSFLDGARSNLDRWSTLMEPKETTST